MQNQSPAKLATEIISENKAPLPKIAIQPQGDHDRGYAPEIITTTQNKKNKTWEIKVRWKTLEEKLQLETEEIKTLFPKTTEEETTNRLAQEITDWWLAIDEELARPRISMAFAESQQQLGTTDIEKKYWNVSPLLNEKQEAILCYFLPFAERIKNEVSEMAYCFSTFLNRPVEVERIGRKKASPINHESNPIHEWRIGLNSIVGGRGAARADEICIKITSDDYEEIKAFLPGRPQRQLLEQVLIPAFVDVKMGRRVELKMTKEKAFTIEKENPIGVNFFNVSA